MKKFICLALVGMLLGYLAVAIADTTTTVTNRGQVITVKTLDNVATDEQDLDVYQDTSTYATKVGEVGTIVRWYDFGTMGSLEGRYHMKPEVPVPDNALIFDGFIDTITAFDSLGHNTTNKFSLITSGDLYAGATNAFFATGLDAIVPVIGTKSTYIQTTSATNFVDIEVIGETNYAGKCMVILRYIQAP